RYQGCFCYITGTLGGNPSIPENSSIFELPDRARSQRFTRRQLFHRSARDGTTDISISQLSDSSGRNRVLPRQGRGQDASLPLMQTVKLGVIDGGGQPFTKQRYQSQSLAEGIHGKSERAGVLCVRVEGRASESGRSA